MAAGSKAKRPGSGTARGVLAAAACIVAPGCSLRTSDPNLDSGAIFTAKATDQVSGAVLLNLCIAAESAAGQRSDLVKFKAGAGAHVLVEELFDSRSDMWYGDPVQRDLAFWCAGGGTSDSPSGGGEPQPCLRVSGTDPPATLDRVENRGSVAGDGTALGYALYLTVIHPGVLSVEFDVQCVAQKYPYVYNKLGFNQPYPHPEVTITQ